MESGLGDDAKLQLVTIMALLQRLDGITLWPEPACLGKLFVMALMDETGLIVIATRPGRGQGLRAQPRDAMVGQGSVKVLQ